MGGLALSVTLGRGGQEIKNSVKITAFIDIFILQVQETHEKFVLKGAGKGIVYDMSSIVLVCNVSFILLKFGLKGFPSSYNLTLKIEASAGFSIINFKKMLKSLKSKWKLLKIMDLSSLQKQAHLWWDF